MHPDVIMVARGDLGCRDRDAELPAAQKSPDQYGALSMNCVVITATQMMESMIVNPIPTGRGVRRRERRDRRY